MLEKQYPKEDSPEIYEELRNEVKESLANWIAKHITLRKTPNYWHSSYGLKHHFERDTGIYVYNGAFKGAMIVAGYAAVDKKKQNWNYKITYHIK